MNKEVFFAIIAGSALGLIIAFGVWKGNSLLKIKTSNSDTTQASSPTTTPEASGNPNAVNKIVVIKPANLDVFTDPTVAITGITSPNAYLVASGEDGDTIEVASQSGNFNTTLDLTAGTNQIKLISFLGDGTTTSTSLLLTYSSQFTPKGTNPTSYVGTVTDITNTVIQIKNSSGDIEQVTSQEGTGFVDLRNDNVKTIQAKDVAIGDYIVAMGSKEQNGILAASRVLVTDAVKETPRTALLGTVSASDPLKLTLTSIKTNEVTTVTPASGIQIDGALRFSGINDGDKIIAVGTLTGSTLEARTIKIIK